MNIHRSDNYCKHCQYDCEDVDCPHSQLYDPRRNTVGNYSSQQGTSWWGLIVTLILWTLLAVALG
jgi:hypothetical protein